MNFEELQHLAVSSRAKREFGITLCISSLILALFLFIPLKQEPQPVASLPPSPETDSPYAHAPVRAKAAIVYDLTTHESLYEKNPTAQLPLASLTKLLTVYAATEVLPSDAPITISREATQVDAPKLFVPGDTLPFFDLARLTLVASLNDGAAALVEAASNTSHTSPSVTLAGAAAALSLSQTFALNGNGLDISPTFSGGYGSARDVAILAGALVTTQNLLALSTTHPSATAHGPRGPISVSNTDPIVTTVPGLLLSKTGFTDLAGGNLALVFDVGMNHPIAVVVLGSTKEARFTDGATLVSATLAYFAGVNHL